MAPFAPFCVQQLQHLCRGLCILHMRLKDCAAHRPAAPGMPALDDLQRCSRKRWKKDIGPNKCLYPGPFKTPKGITYTFVLVRPILRFEANIQSTPFPGLASLIMCPAALQAQCRHDSAHQWFLLSRVAALHERQELNDPSSCAGDLKCMRAGVAQKHRHVVAQDPSTKT